ncbi:hypothetical protein VCE7224_03928 [Vibrio celticus]|uniref:Uncharacterized protein n=1 Tax=Vibrio celticus TaxID=446372 RepID=A0A1C3JJ04_9VIBR|nr:hypothetical protein VCE7224_03928 [Vibrio celticus]
MCTTTGFHCYGCRFLLGDELNELNSAQFVSVNFAARMVMTNEMENRLPEIYTNNCYSGHDGSSKSTTT